MRSKYDINNAQNCQVDTPLVSPNLKYEEEESPEITTRIFTEVDIERV